MLATRIRRSSPRPQPRWLRGVLWSALAALCAACGPPLTGVYEDASGAAKYDFRPDGTVHIAVLGAAATGEYVVERDRVLVTGPQGTVVLVRKRHTLHGPMGLELTARGAPPLDH